MLLKNCRSRLERKQQILSRFVMPGVSFIGYNGSTSTFIKHTAPKYTYLLKKNLYFWLNIKQCNYE